MYAVDGAVGGEGVEVPHLAKEQADVGDRHLVQGLEGVRTSTPQVSVAMAAISVRCSQSAVVKDSPGEGPPA